MNVTKQQILIYDTNNNRKGVVKKQTFIFLFVISKISILNQKKNTANVKKYSMENYKK